MTLTNRGFNTIYAVLEHFQEINLIKYLETNAEFDGGMLILARKAEADKLLQGGGFAVMDALSEANMQKILFELKVLEKQLQPDQLEAINKITTIASSIATVAAAFISRD